MRNFKKENKSESILSCLRLLSGLTSHVLALVFAIIIMYLSSPGSSLFSWHPFTMSLGCGIIMMEAILIFSPESSVMSSASRKNKVRAHWILQTISLALTWVGFVAIVVNKAVHGKAHFTSWHGTMGLITVLYVTFQALFGIILLYPSTAKRWNWKLVQVKVSHATFGLVGFLLATVTMVISLYSNFMTRNADSASWTICLISLIWCASVVMNQVSNTYSYYMTRSPAPL